MDASLILENLEKIDKIHQFISFLEIKFFDHGAKEEKVKLVKKLLGNVLRKLSIDVDAKIKNEEKDLDQTLKIHCKISEILDVFDDILFTTEIKNFDLLMSDLRNIEKFILNYELARDSFSIKGESAVILNLREKILLIASERMR